MHPFPADPSSVSDASQPTSRWVVAGWMAIVLVVPSALALERIFPALDRPYPVASPLYFTGIASTAAIIGTLALVIVITAWQALDNRALAVGLGLLGGAATSLVHALWAVSQPDATPGYPIISLAVVSIFIVISTFEASPVAQDRRQRAWRYVAPFTMLLAFSIGWLFVPVPPGIDALIHLATVIACGFALWRYIQYLDC